MHPNSKNLLGLGLKFIPNPRDISNDELLSEYQNFKRRLDLYYYFNQFPPKNEDYNPKLKITKNTNWNPPNHPFWHAGIKSKLLDLHILLLQMNKPLLSTFDKNTYKLTKYLKEREDVKITESDKNLGLIALPITKYNDLVLQHLKNTKIYTPICLKDSIEYESLLADFMDECHTLNDQITILSKKNNFLNKQERNFIFEINTSLPPFHVLPKLHKKGNLTSRPIVGATAWITTHYSKLLDSLLQPFIKKCKHVITKTKDVIEAIERLQVSENMILFTMDVTSLYTNIQLKLLKETIRKETNNEIITLLLDFILSHNVFFYHNTVYVQTDGISMGTNAAVNLANIFLANRIDTLLEKVKEITYFGRYIDDIFGVWNGTENELYAFFKELNDAVPGIRFTLEHSRTNINFLDIDIKFYNTTKLIVKPYAKELSTFQYIPPFSCHPRSCFKGFIKGELKRLAINSSLPISFFHASILFKFRLLARGFKKSFFTNESIKVPWISRFDKKKAKDTKEQPIPFIIKHTRRNLLPFKNMIHQFKQYTSNEKIKIFIAYKKSPNIKSLCCNSALTIKQKEYLAKVKASEIIPYKPRKRLYICESDTENDENSNSKRKKEIFHNPQI